MSPDWMHIGERLVHRKLGDTSDPIVSSFYTSIDPDLPAHHGKFHSTCLPFVPVATIDGSGRPWGSILAGNDGKPGFIRNPRYAVLSIDAKVWPGEPLIETAKGFSQEGEMLVAGIGIEFSTRRRNKFAGKVTKLDRSSDIYRLELTVHEAVRNCPKYVNVRDLVPHPKTSPTVVHKKLQLSPADRLSQSAVSFIQESDTVFLGTTYVAPASEARLYPSHLGMNQRGGRRGFIRVLPSDGRTIVLPDFSGNRSLSSLGNIEATPLASLTFVSFTTGDILYLTGQAENFLGLEAQKIMPCQNILTTIYTTGYIYVRDALPVRQRPDTVAQPSPYSPPIRYLAEEAQPSKLFGDTDKVSALLTRIDIHSPSIATFTWESSKALHIVPGQAIIMDFSPLLGVAGYRHMYYMNPSVVNDDRIRTITVSSTTFPRGFALTMREKPGGAVTGALFNIARALAEVRPEVLNDSRLLDLTVGMVGIAGYFVLPTSSPSDIPNAGYTKDGELGLVAPQRSLADSTDKKRLLWIAGGIGVTPFLAMLKSLAAGAWDINFILSTREPEVVLPLISAALRPVKLSRVLIDVFSDKPVPNVQTDGGVTLRRHRGRVTRALFDEFKKGEDDFRTREVYLCGPEAFEAVVFDILKGVGIERESVRHEGFGY